MTVQAVRQVLKVRHVTQKIDQGSGSEQPKGPSEGLDGLLSMLSRILAVFSD